MPLAQSAAQADRVMDVKGNKTGYIHAIHPAFALPQFAPTFQPPQYSTSFQPQSNYCQSNSPSPPPVMAPIQQKPPSDFEQLQRQLSQMTQLLTEVVGRTRSQASNSSHSRSQTPARQHQHQQQQQPQPFNAPAVNNGNNVPDGQPKFDICWWHYKFGITARKCKPPCNFNVQGPGNQ